MTDPLLTHDGELLRGTVVDRPNRFVLRVGFDADEDPARVYLGDPGALSTVLDDGSEVLCSPVDDPGRKTDYDAVAAVTDAGYVSLKAALANDLFERALERDAVPAFGGHDAVTREPPLPDHGRADFRLVVDGEPTFVEVKSCTHVEDGVCKFPDRPTERGRRHLQSLESLVEAGTDAHVVFVVQRPDADEVRAFRAVDPAFADVLARVRETGVGVHALSTSFDPPHYHLHDPSLPVRIDR